MLPYSWFLGLNLSDKSLQRSYDSVELRHQDKVGFLKCSPLWEVCKNFAAVICLGSTEATRHKMKTKTWNEKKTVKGKKGALVNVAYTNSLVLLLIHFTFCGIFLRGVKCMYVEIKFNQLEVPLCLCTLRLFLITVKFVWKRKTKQVSQQFHFSRIYHELFMDVLWKSDQQWRITSTGSMLTTTKEFKFYQNVRTIVESICEDYLLNFCHFVML